jgi:hypothetical protein
VRPQSLIDPSTASSGTDSLSASLCLVLKTFMVMPNVIDAFASFDCSKNIYWGTSAGMSRHFGFYMRGLGYALSWPLVRRPALGPLAAAFPN